LSGKTIIPFCTSGTSGLGGSVSSIRGLASGATVLEGRRFAAGARADVNAWIDTLNIVNGGAKASVKIRITINNRVVTATMFDNVTAREFIALLPFTMTLNDYAQREKYGHCAKPLTEVAAGRQKPYKVGDIGYWSPNSDFAVFYRHDGSVMPEPGITMIGTVDGNSVEAFNVTGRVTATFEVIK
jgi:hypothetical protein